MKFILLILCGGVVYYFIITWSYFDGPLIQSKDVKKVFSDADIHCKKFK